MPYSPAPTPPKTIQPSIMFNSGDQPGQRREAVVHRVDRAAGGAVVATAHSTLFITPNRVSLPSSKGCTPPTTGLGRVSAHHASAKLPAKQSTSMTPNRHHAWPRSPTSRPNV